MNAKKLTSRILLAGALALSVPLAGASPAEARNGDKAAVIVGAIVAAAAIAAASKDRRHEKHRNYYHRRGDGPRHARGRSYRGGGRQHAGSYSPARGIVCYYGSRSCYDVTARDGSFALGWTRREFGGRRGY